MPGCARAVLVCAMALCVVAQGIPAHAMEPGRAAREYDLKAVFLSKVTKFVEWPVDAVEPAGRPRFVVTILGDDPFGSALDAAFSEIAPGVRIEVRRVREIARALDADLLFVSASEKARLCEILDSVAGRPILTVSDFPEFVERGGMLALEIRDSKIGLAVNRDASKKAGLRISTKLLSLAREATGGPC